MLSLVEMSSFDLWRIDNINLDPLTETFDFDFYFHYLSNWPDLCLCYRTTEGIIAGFIMGKIENKRVCYGHVSALSVDPEFRRHGIAKKLMNCFEERCLKNYSTVYVDLFVRITNETAINFYKVQNYTIYQKLINYYSNGGDAYEMRKSLAHSGNCST